MFTVKFERKIITTEGAVPTQSIIPSGELLGRGRAGKIIYGDLGPFKLERRLVREWEGTALSTTHRSSHAQTKALFCAPQDELVPTVV